MSGRTTGAATILAALAIAPANGPAWAAPRHAAARTVALPGISYRILRSGPTGGAHPTRSDDIVIRYVGRLLDGRIFSTSADGDAGTSTFSVRTVIPGFSAAAQLMRPGDRWRVTIPSYLAYGALGRRYAPPEATLRIDVPPNSILVFDVELVSIAPTAR
jgi:FKBP-type peptidyl-prolyl cis-trans isomerase